MIYWIGACITYGAIISEKDCPRWWQIPIICLLWPFFWGMFIMDKLNEDEKK